MKTSRLAVIARVNHAFRTFAVLGFWLIVIAAPYATAQQSDQFDGPLDPAVWTFVNPLGDGQARVLSGALVLSVPASVAHDPWVTGNNVPRLLQNVGNTDLAIQIRFTSVPAQKTQDQGLIVQDAQGRFLRFDFFSPSSTSLKFFAARVNGTSATTYANKTIPIGGPVLFLRVRRVGTQWTADYSYDGTEFFLGAQFADTLLPARLGPYVGNTGTPPPAFSARIDSFVNLRQSPAGDRDADGVPDAQDLFPDNPNESRDNDRDGIGDNADLDDDNDGIPDATDPDPTIPAPVGPAVVIEQFVSPPFNGAFAQLDNPTIEANFLETLPGNLVRIQVRAAGQVIASQPVFTDATGRGTLRAPAFAFPIGVSVNLEITYCDQFNVCGKLAGGDSRRSNIRLANVVDVAGVRIHRVTDGVDLPNISPDLARLTLDTENADVASTLSRTLVLDRVLADQCLVNNRIQLRGIPTIDTITVPPGCSRPNLDAPPCFSNFSQLGLFFEDLAFSLGPQFFHFFIVSSLSDRRGPLAGVTAVTPVGFFGTNWAIVDDNAFDMLELSRTILHEYLHTRRLGHPDDPINLNNETVPAANNCVGSGSSFASINLMCSTVQLGSSGGPDTAASGLIPAQCNIAFFNFNIVPDLNP